MVQKSEIVFLTVLVLLVIIECYLNSTLTLALKRMQEVANKIVDKPISAAESPNCSGGKCPKFNCSSIKNESITNETNLHESTEIGKCNNKTYILSKKNLTFADSLEECCRINLSPASFESKEQIDCLLKQIVPMTAWIAASSIQCKGKWTWCDSNQSVSSFLWSNEHAQRTEVRGRCAVLVSDINKQGLDDEECLEVHPVLCQA